MPPAWSTTGSPFEQWRLRGEGPGPLSKTPDVPAPLIHNGLVYIVRQYQRETGALICIDLKTGKEMYYEPIHAARYRASPIYGDGKIYLAARDGTVTVVKAGPKFEVLAVNQARKIRLPLHRRSPMDVSTSAASAVLRSARTANDLVRHRGKRWMIQNDKNA